MTSETKTAPYGSWKSPLTSDLIAAGTIALSEARIDGATVRWLEGRPKEQGRNVIVRAGGAGEDHRDITPAPFNARSRVHEYGGGSWTVVDGAIYFSNFADGRLYRQANASAEPEPLTPPPEPQRQCRYADGVVDPDRHRWIGVREDH